ncbi:MAG TPA: hypothetical protein VKX96_07055 [Chloroflexota bacterium]|nr:hypothetical protein [Chloroflexota bacterium]
MLYRLTTYHVQLTNLEAFRREREDHAWPVLGRRGAVPLGLWRVLMGGRPTDVLEMVRFESLTHWAEVTNAGIDDRPSCPPITEIALRPVSRRHPGGQPQPVAAGSVWALHRFVPQSGQHGRLVELSEDPFWPLAQRDGRQFTLGQFHTHVAEQDAIYVLTYYASLADWEDTRAHTNIFRLTAPTEEQQTAKAAGEERARLLDDAGVCLLWPLSRRVPMRESCVEMGECC